MLFPRFIAIICVVISFGFTIVIEGEKGKYLNEGGSVKLLLNEDYSYRMINVEGQGKHGKVYDKIGYWEEKKGKITLYFTGYDMSGVDKLKVDYKGCSRIEKKPIAVYEYKKKGSKLKPIDSSRGESFVKIDS